MKAEFFNQPVKSLASTEFTAFNRNLTVAEALTQQIIYFYATSIPVKIFWIPGCLC
jgi:hypothetical protein